MHLSFSFVIPVYNRPHELRELLDSILQLNFEADFELIVVEDGSEIDAEDVINDFKNKISLTYLKKKNSGPGDSRNYGMTRANGNYFVILDSDCLLPSNYLKEVVASLTIDYADCYGGPDTAHPSFSTIQKAINYAMTSMLSTGGIRGKEKMLNKFQPRSFNMGMSKQAFEASGGFGKIHPGEDPDLSIRLWKKGFTTKLIPNAFVYHKRRVNFSQYFRQVTKFGKVRPILNIWHPETSKITYWFPSLFCLGFITALFLIFSLNNPYNLILISLYILYFVVVFCDALFKTKNLGVALTSMAAIAIQFCGYGYGFLKSTILVNFTTKKPQEIFPELFF